MQYGRQEHNKHANIKMKYQIHKTHHIARDRKGLAVLFLPITKTEQL
jgi:hypothetical protein